MQSEENDLEKHTVTNGFRYVYDAPKVEEKTVVKIELPACTVDYRVFFGCNEASLDAAVLPILDGAVKESMRDEHSITRV